MYSFIPIPHNFMNQFLSFIQSSQRELVDNLLCTSFGEVLKHFRRAKGVSILLNILADKRVDLVRKSRDVSVRIEDKPD
jgi:hypothetical protein